VKRPTFLTLDEVLALHADQIDGMLTELVLGVAAGKVSKAETTVFIERHSRTRRA
jgi:hypothetical protein